MVRTELVFLEELESLYPASVKTVDGRVGDSFVLAHSEVGVRKDDADGEVIVLRDQTAAGTHATLKDAGGLHFALGFDDRLFGGGHRQTGHADAETVEASSAGVVGVPPSRPHVLEDYVRFPPRPGILRRDDVGQTFRRQDNHIKTSD